MNKQSIAMRRVSFAMIAATAFSLPLISLARAGDGDHMGAPVTKHHVIRDDDRGARKDRGIRGEDRGELRDPLYDTTRNSRDHLESNKPDRDHRD